MAKKKAQWEDPALKYRAAFLARVAIELGKPVTDLTPEEVRGVIDNWTHEKGAGEVRRLMESE